MDSHREIETPRRAADRRAKAADLEWLSIVGPATRAFRSHEPLRLTTIYFFAFILSALFAFLVLGIRVPLTIGALVSFSIGLWFLMLNRDSMKNWWWMWSLLCAVLFVLLWSGVYSFEQYGDDVWVIRLLGDGVTSNRWMLGTALQAHIFKSLESFYFISDWLPGKILDPSFFSRLSSFLCMSFSALFLLKRYPGKSALTFCTLTPVWFTFTTGYAEYYPLVAFILPWIYAYLFEEEHESISPVVIGLIVAALMTVYVAFIPLAILIFLFFALKSPSRLLVLFLVASLAFVVITKLFFHSPEQYLSSLPACMNLGEKNMPAIWSGMSASAESVFFVWHYALSWSHFKEVVLVYFCGGGLLFPVLLGWLILRSGRSLVRLMGIGYAILGLTMVSWFVFYLFFMIPKLGLIRDIDLFFGTYLTIAFFAGYLFDRCDLSGKPEILALIMGNASFSIFLFSMSSVRLI